MSDTPVGSPVLIADDVHITYYIHGGRGVPSASTGRVLATLFGAGLSRQGKRPIEAIHGVTGLPVRRPQA